MRVIRRTQQGESIKKALALSLCFLAEAICPQTRHSSLCRTCDGADGIITAAICPSKCRFRVAGRLAKVPQRMAHNGFEYHVSRKADLHAICCIPNLLIPNAPAQRILDSQSGSPTPYSPAQATDADVWSVNACTHPVTHTHTSLHTCTACWLLDALITCMC